MSGSPSLYLRDRMPRHSMPLAADHDRCSGSRQIFRGDRAAAWCHHLGVRRGFTLQFERRG